MSAQFVLYCRRACAVLVLAGLAACSNVLLAPSPALRPPVLNSVAQADAALAAATAQRAAHEARYASAEQICYARFFVNSCLDVAKERHRTGLAQVRTIEVEAERYKRQAAVDERDRALAQALLDAQNTAAERAAEPPKPAPQPNPPKPVPHAAQDRQAQHAARVKRRAVADEADAALRAARGVAYEKKVQDALARQRDIAARKVDKADKAAKAGEAEQNRKREADKAAQHPQ